MLLAVLLAALLAGPAAADPTAADPTAADPTAADPTAADHPVNGTWVLATSPEAARAAVDAAVEIALADIPTIFRGIARGRMERGLTVCSTYALAVGEAGLRLTCDALPAYERPLEGPFESAGRDGQKLVSDLLVQDRGLVLTWRGEQGTRTNQFRVEGSELVLQASVGSDKLPTPVVWELRYRRE